MVQFGGTIFRWPRKTAQSVPSDTPAGLPRLYSEAQEILYSLSNVFPFVLFPDKIIIRPHHVDVVIGIFFWSGTTTRIQIQDIRQVTLQYNPFFATIEIIPQGPLEQTVVVRYLPKQQATLAKRIITGLVECHQQNIDLSKYTPRQLLAYLEQIGTARE